MTGFSAGDVADAVRRAHLALATGGLEHVLNEADSRLGDGDTGSMLARVFDRLAAVDLGASADLGAAFRALAQAATAATGSSLGTLMGTALLAIAKATKGQASADWSQLHGLLGTALDAMAARGGASLGDKTVLDAISDVAKAIAGLDDPAAIAEASVRAGHTTLERFRGLPCRIGRARMFAEESKRSDDPGMLAFVSLIETVSRKTSHPEGLGR
ncbi:dihydroxyacetone kinase subunit L [Labrys wisconsinensis]|uniref:DhaL domain-containing protein n=1 Tax=Labrys wisconsinensis TaxID=425677 RepID=A0ABU0JM06_9HYPH|nr:dihydroxyacetone kinase subunit L [Labrys wisconsinensis]MDQ0475323.1 hypothetical protein [Labrys wisconsinensis]